MTDLGALTGEAFATALRYLDEELTEAEMLRFEVQLSSDPQLAEDFERVAALDAAQRRLLGGENSGISSSTGSSLLLRLRPWLALAAAGLIVALGIWTRKGGATANSAPDIKVVAIDAGADIDMEWRLRGLNEELRPDTSRSSGSDDFDALASVAHAQEGEQEDISRLRSEFTELALGEEAYEELSASKGTEHPDTLQAKSHLARLLNRSGDLERGLELFQEVLVVQEQALPAGHPALLLTQREVVSAVQAIADRQELTGFFRIGFEAERDCSAVLVGVDHLGNASRLYPMLSEPGYVDNRFLAGRFYVLPRPGFELDESTDPPSPDFNQGFKRPHDVPRMTVVVAVRSSPVDVALTDELDGFLSERNESGRDDLDTWLTSHGFATSTTTVWR